MSADTNSSRFAPLDTLSTELETQLNQTLISKFLAQDCCALQPNLSSYGVFGVYALYYYGDDPFYEPISNVAHKTHVPIFVGVSHPTAYSTYSASDKQTLAQTISSHQTRLTDFDRFNRSDFKIRTLSLEPVWIHHTAQLLIDAYQPWWNTYITGFSPKRNDDVWGRFHDPDTHDETRRAVVEPAIEKAKAERTYKDKHNIGRNELVSMNAPAREEATLNEFARQ